MHWTIFLCSVNGRIVRAPIMMAKSHKRALCYTVVWIYTYVHRKTLSLQRNYGGPMPPKHFMCILLRSQFSYVILSWLWWAVFSVTLFHKMHWACCKIKTNLCKKSSSWNHKKLFHTRYHPKQFFANLLCVSQWKLVFVSYWPAFKEQSSD